MGPTGEIEELEEKRQKLASRDRTVVGGVLKPGLQSDFNTVPLILHLPVLPQSPFITSNRLLIS
jgi:hypothetical protein